MRDLCRNDTYKKYDFRTQDRKILYMMHHFTASLRSYIGIVFKDLLPKNQCFLNAFFAETLIFVCI